METQSEKRRLLITKMDKEINKLGEIKKMLTDYKDKFPDAFESLTNKLLLGLIYYRIKRNQYVQKN